MFRLQRNGRSSINPVAGERTYSRLINAVSSQFVTLIVRGTLTIAGGAADAIRNRGSLWAAFDEIGIDENGRDRQLLDPRVLRMLSEMAAPSALSAKRVSSTAAAAYVLEESARIYFAHPFAAVPKETAFRERDVKQLLQAFAKLNANGAAKLVKTSGAVTATLSGVTITVIHGYDAAEPSLPFFIPTVRQQIAQVASANAQQQEFIKTSNAIRAIVVSQETTTDGEVADIVNKLTLRGDFHDLIGPQPVKWDDLCLDSEYEFGGAVVASPNRAHLGINFQQFGRLASVVSPAQDNNLRFEFDCQPSVAGAGSSQIRITVVELERDPNVTDPNMPIPV